MTAASWVKWYPGDFLHGVSEMSAEEIGVYTVVLCLIYDREGPVAYDPERIGRRVGMRPTTAKKVLDALISIEKLTLENGHLTNARAEKELENRAKVGEKSSASANARWEKERAKSNKNNGNVVALAMPKQCVDDAIPDTRYQIPDSNSSLRSESPLALFSETPQRDTSPAPKPNRFAEGWTAWPHRGRQRSSKSGAAKLWPEQAKAAGGEEKLISAIRAYAAGDDAKREDGQFVPAMERWLKQRKWEPFIDTAPPPRRIGREDWQ